MIKIPTSYVARIMRTLWLIVAAFASELSGRYVKENQQEDEGMS